MAGWVLVVSLLFSPGMLPAERPSHLYLNLIPLCFGCSMISMKGFTVGTARQVEARKGKEMWLNCSVLETQKHSIRFVKQTVNTPLSRSVCQHRNSSVNVYQPCCLLMNSLQSIPYRTLIIYWKQRLTWVERAQVPSIPACGRKQEQKFDWMGQSPWVIGGLPSTLFDTQHTVTAQMTQTKKLLSAHTCGLVRVCHLWHGQDGNLQDGAASKEVKGR